jgi:hypothetical protein
MSPHLSEGTLQQLLDGELSGPELDGAREHLDTCAACSAELRALEAAFATVGRGLLLLNPPEISLDLAHAGWRRRLRGGWWSRAHRHIPRAAVLLLAVAGVASATLPGSPVRGWVESLWEGPPAAVEPRPAPAPVSPPAEAPSAGVSVDAADGELRVLVERSSPQLRIRVRLADQPRMSVRAMGEAAGARFRMGRGRVSVEDAGAGELEVVIPRTAERASLSVDGRRFLLKQGEELRVLVPADSLGTEIVFSAGS